MKPWQRTVVCSVALTSWLAEYTGFIYSCAGGEDGSFTIDLSSFSPGSHSLSILATSDDGEEDIADTILFDVSETLG